MVKKVYRSGVTIKKKAMLAIEGKLERKEAQAGIQGLNHAAPVLAPASETARQKPLQSEGAASVRLAKKNQIPKTDSRQRARVHRDDGRGRRQAAGQHQRRHQ
jgi:hypothetical protein